MMTSRVKMQQKVLLFPILHGGIQLFESDETAGALHLNELDSGAVGGPQRR